MQFKHLARPLSRLFRAAPQDPSAPSDPIAELENAPSPLLIATALGDGDETLRAATIRKLEHSESLTTLAGFRAGAAAAPAGLERLAQQRLAQLVDAGTLDFEELRASAEISPRSSPWRGIAGIPSA